MSFSKKLRHYSNLGRTEKRLEKLLTQFQISYIKGGFEIYEPGTRQAEELLG